jgi:Fe-S oxidoreductase
MSGDKNISYKPTDGLCYDPLEAKYWDEAALQKEVTRVFEVCHGCRMCFKYCESFPDLFRFIDDVHDGDVTKLSARETEQVMDGCFQCKLCEVQCPYTPRDDHEFQLDFPKLVHRYAAIRTKKKGVPLRERMLGNPDKAAKLARASLGMANVMNRVKLHRVFFEKLAGVHRDKKLPLFAGETFEAWAKKTGRVKPPAADVEVVLFQTCYVQNNEPDIGKDAIAVLEKNQVRYACVTALACCGMPAWEHGDLPALQKKAKANLAQLEPYVDAGAKIIGLNPTCTMMLRREYPELVAREDRARAEKIAAATMDSGEFLWSIRKEERFNTDFKTTPGENVAYHAPCHLRAQGVGFKGRDLLKKIPGTKPQAVMECCGHDGTYGMKVETFESSARVGKKSFDEMKRANAEVWVTDCPLAATQFEQFAGVQAIHPMTALARAYREDGYVQKVKKEES